MVGQNRFRISFRIFCEGRPPFIIERRSARLMKTIRKQGERKKWRHRRDVVLFDGRFVYWQIGPIKGCMHRSHILCSKPTSENSVTKFDLCTVRPMPAKDQIDSTSEIVLAKIFRLRYIGSRNAINFSSARTTRRFPLSRCASAIQIVRPSESIAETQSQLQPALLRLSAMISQ